MDEKRSKRPKVRHIGSAPGASDKLARAADIEQFCRRLDETKANLRAGKLAHVCVTMVDRQQRAGTDEAWAWPKTDSPPPQTWPRLMLAALDEQRFRIMHWMWDMEGDGEDDGAETEDDGA